MPEELIEEFAAQRARMRDLLAQMDCEPDAILFEGRVVLAGDVARLINSSFCDLARLNLYLMDLLVKGHFH